MTKKKIDLSQELLQEQFELAVKLHKKAESERELAILKEYHTRKTIIKAQLALHGIKLGVTRCITSDGKRGGISEIDELYRDEETGEFLYTLVHLGKNLEHKVFILKRAAKFGRDFRIATASECDDLPYELHIKLVKRDDKRTPVQKIVRECIEKYGFFTSDLCGFSTGRFIPGPLDPIHNVARRQFNIHSKAVLKQFTPENIHVVLIESPVPFKIEKKIVYGDVDKAIELSRKMGGNKVVAKYRVDQGKNHKVKISS